MGSCQNKRKKKEVICIDNKGFKFNNRQWFWNGRANPWDGGEPEWVGYDTFASALIELHFQSFS